MAHKIVIERLTKTNFQDFGNIIDTDCDPDKSVSYTHLTLPTKLIE